MTRVRVGLNLLFLVSGSSGIGRLAQELAAALAARDDVELEVFHHQQAPADLFAMPNASRVRFTPVTSRPPGSPRYLWDQFIKLPLIAMLHRTDVLHSPAMTGPVLIPGVSSAISIHDVTWRREGDDWGDASAQRALDRLAVPAAHLADQLLTGTQVAADDVCDELGLSHDRMSIVSNGARYEPTEAFTSEADLRAELDLGEGPILLCVAQKLRFKNQEILLRALARLTDTPAVLVMPGASTPYEEHLRGLASDLGLSDRVRFPSWISNEALEGLYRCSTAVLQPSRTEGFGLPVIEAMARGVPVLCSSTSALGEVGGSATIALDPEDVDAWAHNIRRVLEDPELRARLADAGRVRAAEFTWARSAALSTEAYRKAIAHRRGRARRVFAWIRR